MDATPPKLVALPELHERTRVFRDRAHAGEVLAGMLAPSRPLRRSCSRSPQAASRSAPRWRAARSAVRPGGGQQGPAALGHRGWLRGGRVRRHRSSERADGAALGISPETVEAGLATTRERVARRVRTCGGPAAAGPARRVPRSSSTTASPPASRCWSRSRRCAAAGPPTVVVAVPRGISSLLRILPHVDRLFCANVRARAEFRGR